MFRLKDRVVGYFLGSICLVLCGCGAGAGGGPPPGSFQLSIQAAGAGVGTISSNPVGINCGTTCSAAFASGTQVTLTETAAAKSDFAGWTGACTSNNSSCTLTLSASQQVTATFSTTQSVAALNHIIFLAQENRSFDHYFGSAFQQTLGNLFFLSTGITVKIDIHFIIKLVAGENYFVGIDE